MRRGVAALVPAFNEERNIAEVIRRTRPFVDRIVVIDDGSTDRTAVRARAAGATVLRHPINRGKGEALRTGFAHLRRLPGARWVVIIDADLQFAPEDASALLAPLQAGRAEFVMGARDWTAVPFRHRLGNWLWRTTFNLLFGTRLPDTNCGFVAMSKEAAERLDFHGGYIIESAMLVSAVRARLRLASVPVRITYHRVSTVPRGLRVVFGVLIYILREGVRTRLGGKVL